MRSALIAFTFASRRFAAAGSTPARSCAFAASRAARASTSVMAVELAGIAELVRLVSRLRCLDLRVGEQRSPPNTMDALGRPMHPTIASYHAIS